MVCYSLVGVVSTSTIIAEEGGGNDPMVSSHGWWTFPDSFVRPPISPTDSKRGNCFDDRRKTYRGRRGSERRSIRLDRCWLSDSFPRSFTGVMACRNIYTQILRVMVYLCGAITNRPSGRAM